MKLLERLYLFGRDTVASFFMTSACRGDASTSTLSAFPSSSGWRLVLKGLHAPLTHGTLWAFLIPRERSSS
ncbi:hypothetical protein DL93DRAFT_2089514 [Clavulina sp. PMI_390]|nr:hypothetical protein DL93DRAFT_2089514 [Clavulina sp. PMI_390]